MTTIRLNKWIYVLCAVALCFCRQISRVLRETRRSATFVMSMSIALVAGNVPDAGLGLGAREFETLYRALSDLGRRPSLLHDVEPLARLITGKLHDPDALVIIVMVMTGQPPEL